MGLGLAMSKKIIENMGGDISFETAEGQGSTFFVRLPMRD
jgi:signal transduction histidine kinase